MVLHLKKKKESKHRECLVETITDADYTDNLKLQDFFHSTKQCLCKSL